MSIKHTFKNGSRRIMPAPERAYSDQPKKIQTKIEPTIAGYREPETESLAISSPAPEAKYQSGPPIIIAMWSKPARKVNTEP